MQQITSSTQKPQSGRWTKQQHQRFMYAIMQYGKDWKKVEDYVKSRSGSQVRSHAQKFFNKLQKNNHHHDTRGNQGNQEMSETELDFQREMNNEVTPSTPMELVSLIRKESKGEGGKVNLQELKSKLEQKHEQIKHKPQNLARQNSYKGMSNILSAYEQLNSQNVKSNTEDESFLILLTKRYKKYFGEINQFDKLIDINTPGVYAGEPVGRKRSFTLPEGSELEGEELDEKIQEIKKKINTEPENRTKLIISKSQEKKEVKDNSSKSVDLKNGEVMLPLNRLATIQEKAGDDEEFNACRGLEKVEGNNDPKK